MQGFLIALIECSISMSVLVLGLIALTPWLSKRYTAKWLYYAWLVIVVGLIIPFRLHPDTALIKMDTAPSYIQQIMPGNVGNIADPTIQSDTKNQGFPVIPWYQIVGFIWTAGTITFIVYHGLKHYRFIRMVNRWGEQTTNPRMLEALQKIKDDIGISKQVRLQICSCVSSPMMIGFLSPVILLPQANFSTDELSLILKHELIHFKRKDLWYKSLMFFATAMHWFNPVIYLMAKAIAVQCEISCDAEVVKGTDMDRRQQYSKTIIGVIKNQSRMQTAFSTNLCGGKKGMKNRIFSIMDTTKKKTGAALLCLILICTVGTGVVFAASSNTAYLSKTSDKKTEFTGDLFTRSIQFDDKKIQSDNEEEFIATVKAYIDEQVASGKMTRNYENKQIIKLGQREISVQFKKHPTRESTYILESTSN